MRALLLAGSAVGLVLGALAPGEARADEFITYSYDALGRLTGTHSSGTVNNNYRASYCYDAAGNRTLVRTDLAGGAVSCPSTGTPTPTPTPTPGPSPTPGPTPTLSIDDASGTEGETLVFPVTLSAAAAGPVSVSYATAFGSAGSTDIIATSGTLTFAPGQTSATIPVVTRQNTVLENDETFTINLSGPSGATIADGQATGTIFDDDETQTCGQYVC